MIILASLNVIDLTPACFVKSTAACAEIDALAPFPAKISLFLLFNGLGLLGGSIYL